jgi:hypothetical protein
LSATACLASSAESAVVEAPLSGGAFLVRPARSNIRRGEPLAMPARRQVDTAEVGFGGRDCAVEARTLGRQLGVAGLRGGKIGPRLAPQRLEPGRDRATPRCDRSSLRFVTACHFGESTTLDDGGDVRAVEGENPLEDVAGLRDVVAVCDDTHQVFLAAAGGGDVQATTRRRR